MKQLPNASAALLAGLVLALATPACDSSGASSPSTEDTFSDALADLVGSDAAEPDATAEPDEGAGPDTAVPPDATAAPDTAATPDTTIEPDTAPAPPTWTDDVAPIMQTYCASCHGFASSYQSMQFMAAQANGRMQAGIMPPGCSSHGPGCPTTDELAIMQAWVDAGLPE